MGGSRTALAVLSCAGAATALPVLGGYDMVAYFSLPPTAHGVMGSVAHSLNISTTDASGGEHKPLGSYEFREPTKQNLPRTRGSSRPSTAVSDRTESRLRPRLHAGLG